MVVWGADVVGVLGGGGGGRARGRLRQLRFFYFFFALQKARELTFSLPRDDGVVEMPVARGDWGREIDSPRRRDRGGVRRDRAVFAAGDVWSMSERLPFNRRTTFFQRY